MITGKVAQYLDVVPLPVILAVMVIGLVVVVAIPARLRHEVSLAVLPVWLLISFLPGFNQTLANVCKATSIVPFAFVAYAAWKHPGPRRSLSWVMGLYVVMALITPLYVVTTTDAALGLALRLTWLMLLTSALLTVRTIVDDRRLVAVIRAIGFGCCVGTLILAAALVFARGQSFGSGLGRFFPWGSNPEPIGVIVVLTVVFCSYGGYRVAHPVWRPVMLSFAGLAFGIGLLTGSRGVMLATVAPLVPLVIHVTRRPTLALLGTVLMIVPLMFVLKRVKEASLGRLGTIASERFARYDPILTEINQRPLLGLAGTQGKSFFIVENVGHTHNSYLTMLYIGGLSYFLPMLVAILCVLGSTFYCVRHANRLSNDNLMLQMLGMLMLTMYLHGFVNDTVFWPTQTWAFVHVILAALFTSAASDLRKHRATSMLPSGYAPASPGYA